MKNCWMETSGVVYEREVTSLQLNLTKYFGSISVGSTHTIKQTERERERERDLRNPNNFTRDIHKLASFLSALIVHPVLIAIYKSSWHCPLRSTGRTRKRFIARWKKKKNPFWPINFGVAKKHYDTFKKQLPVENIMSGTALWIFKQRREKRENIYI